VRLDALVAPTALVIGVAQAAVLHEGSITARSGGARQGQDSSVISIDAVADVHRQGRSDGLLGPGRADAQDPGGTRLNRGLRCTGEQFDVPGEIAVARTEWPTDFHVY
jgi:hypothetical protein